MTDAEQCSTQIPPGVMDALLRPSQTRPTSRTLDSFPTGLAELTTSESASSKHNKYDLLCPRPECASLILRTGVASLVEKHSLQVSRVYPFTLKRPADQAHMCGNSWNLPTAHIRSFRLSLIPPRRRIGG
ncbi:hypothetical protein R3P38DRAFT_3165772 [Favolaschia claudopus]|uniref:Uncharacterized protein n=1 Tax=Favolaschia claudopus TaxID=2862362 RepID=A0AAW0EH21_9AGAR